MVANYKIKVTLKAFVCHNDKNIELIDYGIEKDCEDVWRLGG